MINASKSLIVVVIIQSKKENNNQVDKILEECSTRKTKLVGKLMTNAHAHCPGSAAPRCGYIGIFLVFRTEEARIFLRLS